MLILLRKKLTLFNLQQGVEAKELYNADVGSSFTLEHCWVILQHSPKWQETMDKLASQNKKETKKTRRRNIDKGGKRMGKINKYSWDSGHNQYNWQ
jgi:hypothetical protein